MHELAVPVVCSSSSTAPAAAIRESYLSQGHARTRSSIQLLAKRVGIPHWALKKRARELGLARTKELPWGEAELGTLSRYAWMSDERIRLKLKLPDTVVL